MKKIYASLFVVLGMAATASAQTDMSFEPGQTGAGYAWNVFENDTNPALEFVANPSATGINTSGTVAKFTALLTGQPYAGTETQQPGNQPGQGGPGTGNFVLDAAHSTIKIMVYKTTISPVGIKLITTTDDALIEKKVTNTLINQWEELTYDFSDHINSPFLPAGYSFNQIVVFPDFTNGPRTATNIIYFDNIVFGESDITQNPQTPMTAAPDPTADAANVLSMFSGVYTNVAVNTWRTDWSTGLLEDVAIAGNATKKYTNMGVIGIETTGDNMIDATDMTHFNLNVWSADFTTFKVKLVDFGADGIYQGPGQGDDKEHEITFNSPAQGSWITYNIALSDFTNLTTRANIAQIILVGETGATMYVDNVYFSNEDVVVNPNEPMTAAPDPTIAEANVISLFSNVYTDIPMATWRTEWSSADLTEVQIQGNDTKKYANLSFVGAEPVTQIDATEMTHFNVDVWSADFTLLKIKLVDFGADGIYQGPGLGDDKEDELIYQTPVQSGWITYHIALSDFADLTTRANMQQFIFSSDGTSTVFIDNVYFSKDVEAGVTAFSKNKAVVYPNPVNDIITIQAGTSIDNITVYNVTGQQVLTLTPNSTTAAVNVAQLHSGVYMVNTVIGGTVQSQKFVKQ